MNHSNNAFSVLNGSITNVATAITVATGTGSRFPASNFMVTLVGYDGSGNENAWEICRCSSRSGDVLTVVRGQESTAAVAWANATRIENRLTAGTLGNLMHLAVGGTVTQATSKSTAVTLNKPSGQITTHNAALAAGAEIGFIFINSVITATQDLVLTGANSLAANYTIRVGNMSAGAASIYIKNVSGGSLSDAVQFNFRVLTGATA